MAGATIANATIAITPKFPNLQNQIAQALGANGVTQTTTKAGTSAGSSFSSSFGSSILKSGAIAGAVSAVASKAIQTVSNSMSAAISRFDTLNNYPQVMQTLGYETDIVNASLSTMDERLQGLPTSLDSMVSLVQGLVTCTGDLELATDAGLALNDMLIASGSSTELTSAAMEQFRQILAKGKPEMQDWRSLTSAMPGQMDQLAKSMLGAEANANDLYKALGGGGEEATITTTDLLNAMIKLDKEGGDGITSFAEQAKTASGGVATSMANLQTAITRGLASTLEAIGKDTIADAFSAVRDAINDTFTTVNGVIKAVMPTIKSTVIPALQSLLGVVKELSPAILSVVTALVGLNVAKTLKTTLTPVIATVKNLSTAFGLARAGAGTLTEALGACGVAFNPLTLGITAAAAAIGLAVSAFMSWKEKTEAAEKATQGLRDAVANTAALDTYSGKVSGIGTSASTTRVSIDELNESIGSHVDKINETTKAAQAEIAQLNTAQQVISDYTGVSDLTTEQQGKLEWALSLVNEQFGLSIDATDVLAGKYEDANGATVDLKDSIYDLIEAKKQELQVQAKLNSLSEVYAAKEEASSAYGKEYNATYGEGGLYDSYYQSIVASYLNGDRIAGFGEDIYETAEQEARKFADAHLKPFKEDLDAITESAKELEAKTGDLIQSTSEAANEYDKWGNTLRDTHADIAAILDEKFDGNGFAMLKDDLEKLGASTEDLSNASSEDLQRLVDSYDGSAGSIVGILAEMGVAVDETAAANAIAAQNIAQAFSDMGLQLGEIDMSVFTQKLADAGVSTETLNAIGSENLSALAQACGYNMDTMVWAVTHYNDTPLLDKDSTVQVDDLSLIDAQGNVYTWNGSTLYDKDNIVVTDDVDLLDAQGNLWTWNGSTLEDKESGAYVDDGQLVNANGEVSTWQNSGDLGTKNGFINIIRSVTEIFSSGNAAGGIRLNAQGGYRFHAGGAIARRAVPLDIVGEAGAEAIVPLTNKRYSKPFADIIAEQINAGRDTSANAREVTNWLAQNLPAIIAAYTPTISERDFARKTRKAVAYG